MTDCNQPKVSNGVFAPDAPLTDPEEDLLDRWPFSKRLADAIAFRRDPSSIVVAVYGAWGDGKTTVLNFVETELRKHDDILCVKFNPWQFGDENRLLQGFFILLAETLGKSLSTQKEKIGDALSKYGTFVTSMTVPFAYFGLSPGQIAAKIGKQLSYVTLDDLRQRIETLLAETQKRVVVLMDDIDRLDKSEIYAVFKLVKLTADFKHTAYVLAFDDVMVASALQERYPSGRTESGSSFLEKIIQVPLNLPLAERFALRQLCFRSVEQALEDSGIELKDLQAQSFTRHFVNSLEPGLKTPRMCKRYANALSFALPILKGEVNPVDLMLIEGLRVFYPSVYAMIRDNPGIFHGTIDERRNMDDIKEKTQKLLGTGLEAFTSTERESLELLLKTLFPKLSGLLGGSRYGSDWHKSWSKGQRICSPDYFTRYFTYAVPTGDVADSAVNKFLELLKGQSVQETAKKLRALVNSRNAEKAVQKLSERVKNLDPEDSTTLAKAICSVGEIFPNIKHMLFVDTWLFIAILVRKLLLNVTDSNQRLTAAKEIAQEATPLNFCMTCVRWLLSEEDIPEEERLFDKENETEIKRLAAIRIAAEAEECNLYEKYQDNANFLVWAWSYWGDKEQASKYLFKLFDSDVTITNVIAFLESYLSTSWSLETGISGKGNFERDNFNSVARLIDPKVIMEKLVAHFGEDLRSAKPEQWEYGAYPSDKKVAYQFAGIFNYVQKERESCEEKAEELSSEPASNKDSKEVLS